MPRWARAPEDVVSLAACYLSGAAIMHYLVYEKVTFRTALSPAQIGERLSPKVEPNKWFTFRWPRKPFVGRIDASLLGSTAPAVFEGGSDPAFKIGFFPKGPNSFAPLIVGRLVSDGQGTRVILTFRLHSVVAIFFLSCTFWIFRTSPVDIGLTMSMLMWTACLVFFNLDRQKAKRLLFELFEGTRDVAFTPAA
jgi:hypothetical protein